MTAVQVAVVTHHRLPARRYGGTQRVVVWLARALRDLGHDVTVVARRGSALEGLRVETRSRRQLERIYFDPRFDASALLPARADVAHFQTRVRARIPIPHLMTIHGNAEPGTYPSNAVFLSRDHRTRMGGRHYVYNGIDPADHRFRAEKDAYYLFLGKTSRRVKGVGLAERVARRAGVRLVVAGGWRPRLRRRIRWVGPVGGAQKAELLAGARALLFPIEWAEPFGLVVVEAWMSGTPVLAAPRGSTVELMREDVGELCETEEEFVAAVQALERDPGRFDPWACRRYAEEAFGHHRMARDYLALYERAIREGWGLRDT